MSAPQVAPPAQILQAGNVFKAGALPDDISINGFQIWDLRSFGPAFVTVAFLMFMLVQMARHWTFWRAVGKPFDVTVGTLSDGTLAALKDLEDIAFLLLKVGTILFGAFLISRGLKNKTLAPSSFVMAVVVIAFTYLIEIVLQGVKVWGYKASGGSGSSFFQNCASADGRNSFPLADASAARTPTGGVAGDQVTMVCPFAALLQNNVYIFAKYINTWSLSWEALVLAAAMAAAEIGFTFY